MAIERWETADGEPRWTVRFYIGRDEGGKRRYITKTFDRQGDADREETRLKRLKHKGARFRADSKETLTKYLERWLDRKAGTVRARTIHDYRGLVRRYVQDPPEGAPYIGAFRLTDLSPDTFQELYNWLWSQGRSPRTIQYLNTVLRMALKEAVEDRRILASNPAPAPKTLPKRAKDSATVEQTQVRAMDREQAARFLEAARSDRYYALWTVLLTGGLRPSEALGLKWSDVDFKKGRIHVARSLSRTGVKGWKLLKPKTKAGSRTVPLPGVAMRALKEWRRTTAAEQLQAGPEYEDHGFVFTTPFGKPLHWSNVTRGPFRRVMEEAGLGEHGPEAKKPARGPRPNRKFDPAFTPYDLRHTMATLLLLQGVSPKVVQERLGHAKIQMTLDTYSHVLPSMQKAAADELEVMFPSG